MFQSHMRFYVMQGFMLAWVRTATPSPQKKIAPGQPSLNLLSTILVF